MKLLLAHAGLRVYRAPKSELLAEFRVGQIGGNQWNFERLLALNLDPDIVIDVGVAEGTPDLYHAFPSSRLILVEPVPAFHPRITALVNGRDYLLIEKAAGRAKGTSHFYLNATHPHQSSLYKRIVHNENGITVEVDTLDSILASIPGARLLLKIDTEGAEIDTLLGSLETLKRTCCVIVEVNMGFGFENPRNSLPEVNKLLTEANFDLFCIMDAVTRGGYLNAKVTKADLCYVKHDLL